MKSYHRIDENVPLKKFIDGFETIDSCIVSCKIVPVFLLTGFGCDCPPPPPGHFDIFLGIKNSFM
jgi:hypothetical protein